MNNYNACDMSFLLDLMRGYLMPNTPLSAVDEFV